MLRSLIDIERYTVAATDGDIGTVENFLLDDERWTVRYLVAETGNFLGGRRVLISPISFRQADWSTSSFHVQLTMDKVRHSPSVDVDQPVSRQHESDLSRYYQYAPYWGFAGVWGISGYPIGLAERSVSEPEAATDEVAKSADAHLRSVNELRRYHVQGNDDQVGHIHDFVIDDETWEIRYLVIEAGNWWAGNRVLMAPQWVTRISWTDSKVYFDKSREEIKKSPKWTPDALINREYETRLYDYYGRPAYWEGLPLPSQGPHAAIRPAR